MNNSETQLKREIAADAAARDRREHPLASALRAVLYEALSVQLDEPARRELEDLILLLPDDRDPGPAALRLVALSAVKAGLSLDRVLEIAIDRMEILR